MDDADRRKSYKLTNETYAEKYKTTEPLAEKETDKQDE